jgi:hypothetical protein
MKPDLNSHSPAVAAWLRAERGSSSPSVVPIPELRGNAGRFTAPLAVSQAVPI